MERPIPPARRAGDNDRGRWAVPRILVVEDERKVLRSLERGLRAEGYEVVAASTGDEGYQPAVARKPDGVVLDLMLPGRDGLRVLADLRRAGETVPVLVL